MSSVIAASNPKLALAFALDILDRRRVVLCLLIVSMAMAAGCEKPEEQTVNVGGVTYAFGSETGLFGKRRDRTGGVAIAGLGADGVNDIFVVNGRHWEEDNVLMRNQQSALEFDEQIIGLAPNTGYGACPGDVDNDGDMDVIVARDGPPPGVYVNSGNRTFLEVVDIGRPTASRDCAVEDLNGDGTLDVVFSERGGQSYALLGPLLNSPERIDLFEGPAVGVSTGDVDGDGLVDIAFSLRGMASVALLRQNTDGSFGPFEVFGSAAEESRALASHDIDGDGTSEIVLAGLTGPSRILKFAGGALVTSHVFEGVDTASAVAVADLNDDGQDDFVFGVRGRNVVVLAKGEVYETVVLPGIEATTYDVATGDLNGDSVPDLVFANSGAKNEILLSLEN